MGIPAEDYDILNDFGQTDHIIDLFGEIEKAYNNEPSIFDNIGTDELIMAFFPCTRFEDQIMLHYRGDSYEMKNWAIEDKIRNTMRLNGELHDMFLLISKLVLVCLEMRLRLIIENPYSAQHYLKQYWCVKPAIIDKDRTERGDVYKKPTQYFFINCEPENNLIFEPLTYVKTEKQKFGYKSAMERSLIHPQYANRFIREHILEAEE